MVSFICSVFISYSKEKELQQLTLVHGICKGQCSIAKYEHYLIVILQKYLQLQLTVIIAWLYIIYLYYIFFMA